MPLPTNPYTAGDPVGKTPYFIGREDVLREVERVLRNANQNAITLHGQRRIGKTSILQYLEAHLQERGNFIPVYFDLMNRAGLSLDEILYELARTIALKLKRPEPDLGNNAESSFRNVFLTGILKAIPENTSLILLLDEFDVLADPQAGQRIKTQFFGYLRELRQFAPQRLRFVFVLGRNVDDLDIVARGLFKDLPAYRVSLFNQETAEALIRLSEREKTMQWVDEAVQRVWELTAGHPYLTQALCYQIWEDAHDRLDVPEPIQVQDVDVAVLGAMERSANMFGWLWDGLGPAEKVAAAALASAGVNIVDEDLLGSILAESGVRILIGELRDAPHKLKEWDILEPAHSGYRFRVELLRRWVVGNKPITRIQRELDFINPVAENLFRAAQGMYQAGNLDESEADLRRAIGLNPHHIRANELLSEILIAKDNLDDAQSLLERLHEFAPQKARARLKQIYLSHADRTSIPEERLNWVEKLLKISPYDHQALEIRENTYTELGELAFLRKDLPAAIEFYEQAGDQNRAEEIRTISRHLEVKEALSKMFELEKEEAYDDACQHVLKMMKIYPEVRNWSRDLARLEKKNRLGTNYSQSVTKISDQTISRELLREIGLENLANENAPHNLQYIRGQETYVPTSKNNILSTEGIIPVLL